HADGGSRGVGFAEVFGHDLVDGREVRQIGQENRRLDHLVEGGAGGRDDGLDVVEHTARLRLDVSLDQVLGDRIQGDLTRKPQGVAGPYGFRIRGAGGGG